MSEEKDVLNRVLERINYECLRHYGENLLSVVVYGSVARGDFKEGSDIDILVILRESRDTMGMRISEFMKLVWKIEETLDWRELEKRGMLRRIEPVVYTEERFKRHPPLILDMVFDSIILHDKEETFKREIEIVKRRLEELGSKRIFLENGKWFWILKPDIKWGEVIEI